MLVSGYRLRLRQRVPAAVLAVLSVTSAVPASAAGTTLVGVASARQVISGDSLPTAQVYFNGTYGRLRTVEPAPDGGLWLTTSNVGDKDSTPNNSNEKILHVALS